MENDWTREIEALRVRVKEAQLAHAERDCIHGSLKRSCEVCELQERVKELEAERDGYRNGQEQLQAMLDSAYESNNKHGAARKEYLARIQDLEAELESHAWEISPAMAMTKIDRLNDKVEQLKARDKEFYVLEAMHKDQIAKYNVVLRAYVSQILQLEARNRDLEARAGE